MNQPQFAIKKVLAKMPATLHIWFCDDWVGEAELSYVITKHPSLSRLTDPKIFAQVAPDEWNRGVIFAGDDDLTLASDNLRALAIEQSGEYSHQQVVAWMHHHGLSLDTAADALGISRRMLAYYRSGERPIPKTVGLAMLGWEAQESGHHLNAYDKVA